MSPLPKSVLSVVSTSLSPQDQSSGKSRVQPSQAIVEVLAGSEDLATGNTLNPAGPFPADEPPPEHKKNKGGRPKKRTEQLRKYKHTVFLSEAEEKQLKQLMDKTGRSEAELFRYGLFEKGLPIPRARLIPDELRETLADFKRLASLHQYLSHKEKDFSVQEREQLLGSGQSLRAAIERLQRSVFLSLDKADELRALREVIDGLTGLGRVLKEKETWTVSERKALEKGIGQADRLLQHFYQYLTLT